MLPSLSRIGLGLAAALVLAASTPAAADETVSSEAVVEGSRESIWRLLTTREGLESWIVPHANVDLRVGGFLRTNHVANGKIGDGNTVTNVILSLSSKKKFTVKLVEAPQTIPLAKSLVGTWYEITLSEVSKTRTRVRCVGHGFPEGPMGYAGRTIAGQGNDWALRELQKYCLSRKAAK